MSGGPPFHQYAVRTVNDQPGPDPVLSAADVGAQPSSPELTGIVAAASATGILVRTAAGAWALRTITTPNNGLVTTNPAGVAGNVIINLANDAAALEALTGAGYAVRTATDTWALRTLTSGAGVNVTNGTGVGGSPVFNIDLGYAYAWTAAHTFGGTVTLSADPTTDLQAATKRYVDNIAAGLDVKASARLASTANLALSGLSAIDGVTPVAGDRVLAKNQTTPSQNGIYVAAAGTWARSADMDSWAEVPGANVWVEEGTANADTAWVCIANSGGTIGTTAITWTQFGGTGAYQASSANLSTVAAYASLANLTALVGLTGAADRLAYFTGAGALSLTVFTAAGRALVDDADNNAQRVTLGIDVRTPHGDSDYTILPTDRVVAINATFTADHTFTLPLANSVNPGQSVWIDVMGGLTNFRLLVARQGTDTINASASSLVFTRNRSLIEFKSNGSNGWTCDARILNMETTDTGWSAMTGSGSKAAIAAAAAGTASAAYVQAEAQSDKNRIAAMEARLKSLDAMLFARGLIGS